MLPAAGRRLWRTGKGSIHSYIQMATVGWWGPGAGAGAGEGAGDLPYLSVALLNDKWKGRQQKKTTSPVRGKAIMIMKTQLAKEASVMAMAIWSISQGRSQV